MRRQKRAIVYSLAGLLLVFVGLSQSQEVVNACNHIQNELVGWWKFDDEAGNAATDSSGYGNDGELIGLAAFTTDALVGSAVDFSSGDDGVVVPYDPSLEPATGTFQVWVKVSQPQDSDVIKKRTDLAVRTGESGQFAVYGLRVRSDGAVLGYIMNDDPEMDEPWTFTETKPEMITLGEWHQLVMRWDGKKFDLFVDGKKQDSVEYNEIPDLGLSYHDSGFFGLGLGTFWDGSYDHEFIGQLDDVRLFAGPRSNWQIWVDYLMRGESAPADHPSDESIKRFRHRFHKDFWWKRWREDMPGKEGKEH